MFLIPAQYIVGKEKRTVTITNCKGAHHPETGKAFMVVDWQEGKKKHKRVMIEEAAYKKWIRVPGTTSYLKDVLGIAQEDLNLMKKHKTILKNEMGTSKYQKVLSDLKVAVADEKHFSTLTSK